MCVIGVWVYWCAQYWCVGVFVCTAKQWNPSNTTPTGRRKCPFRDVSSIQGHPYRAVHEEHNPSLWSHKQPMQR